VENFNVAPPSNFSSNKGYFSTLTALRGIGALWMMLYHIDLIIYYRELGTFLPRSYSGLLAKGYLWVDFFFILSGFVLMHIYAPRFQDKLSVTVIKRYVKARFFRIYPLHLFTLLLLLIFVVVISHFLPKIMGGSWSSYFDEQAFIGNLLMLNAVGQHDNLSWNIVSWSIGAQWWVYLAAIGLFFTVNVKHPMRTVLVVVVNIAALALLMYSSTKQNLDITFHRGVLRCLFEFSIGTCLYVFYQRGLARQLLEKTAVWMVVILAIIATFHWCLNDLLVIPLFSLLILTSVYNKGWVNRLLMGSWLQYLGKISYSIYLMHGVYFMFCWFLLPEFTRYLGITSLSVFQIFIYCVSFMALTIISAGFSFKYIEVPSRTLFRS
jgi:peptidoglycan/LPS O-acetylase OafA/YrhL